VLEAQQTIIFNKRGKKQKQEAGRKDGFLTLFQQGDKKRFSGGRNA
jgi:hypothetical protein